LVQGLALPLKVLYRRNALGGAGTEGDPGDMHNHGRKGGWIVGLTLGLCLLAPGSALAEHDLKIYKAEKQVDITADERALTVSCESGDHAIDGMWRVDHADFDDYKPDLDNIRTAVDVLQASLTSDDTYTFRFTKNAIGRVQMKIFVTCIGDKTVGGAHDHFLATQFVNHSGAAALNSGYSTNSATATGVSNTGATPVISTITTATNSRNCPVNTILVSPGFDMPATGILDASPAVTDPSEGMGRLFRSSHTSTSGANAGRDWTWSFDNGALPTGYKATINTTWRCLKLKVDPAPSGEKHKLVRKFKTSVFNPSPNGTSEGRLDCGDHYKAIVGGFAISGPAGVVYTTTDEFDNVWYLGMDPRIKQRAYKFLNKHASTSTFTVDLSLTCLNYRTT
jgi:hypothetical protein